MSESDSSFNVFVSSAIVAARPSPKAAAAGTAVPVLTALTRELSSGPSHNSNRRCEC